MAFLSLIDERVKPKGSRDPLGFELVWSYFGRKVIGNLTTITSSMDNFAVALLGFYWANQLSPYGANIRTSRMILFPSNITDSLFVQCPMSYNPFTSSYRPGRLA
jgi:hypothetical protein